MVVSLSELVNPIPKDMVFKYQLGEKVRYNGKLYSIQRKRDCDGKPSYLLHACFESNTEDKVLETELTEVKNNDMINELWDSFVYTGDNKAAWNFVMKKICGNCCMKNVEWCSNEDCTKYCLKYTCPKSGEVKTLEKNKV